LKKNIEISGYLLYLYSMAKVLVVEDDNDVRELIVAGLNVMKYESFEADCGKKALAIAESNPPDLILLDLMLPDIDGLVVADKIRKNEKTSSVPIVIITARVGVANVIKGLQMGAVDYVTKPFDVMELMARVQAQLRRNTEIVSSAHLPGVSLDKAQRTLAVNGTTIRGLTEKEFAILAILVEKSPELLSRKTIHEQVWGTPFPKQSRHIDVHIKSIRQKMGPALSHRITSIKGKGYRFIKS
jgi:DNA-binding response OmpR family regulator